MSLDKDKQVSCKTIHGHSTNQEPYPTHSADCPQKLISSNEHPAVSANQVLSIPEMLLCAICQNTLDQPIQLSCDTLVCTGCLVQQLTSSAQTFCPFCSPPHQLTRDYQTSITDDTKVAARCTGEMHDMQTRWAFIGNHVTGHYRW